MNLDINKEKNPISDYQPPEDVVAITAIVKKDYSIGDYILKKAWVELNNRSVIDDQNRGNLMFNAFVDTSSETEEEAREWKGTRSTARNKALIVTAQMTVNYLLPLYEAQNSDDDVDKDFSEVMRDIVEWMAQPTVSNYQEQFLQVVFGMMTNPVTFLSAEFCEVWQEIKEKVGNGIKTKKVLDEVLSGFKVGIWDAQEVLITNAFERNIQKQRAIIQRRYKDYTELEAKYGEHKNWKYVQKHIKAVYSEEDGVFYDVKDDDLRENTCIEEIWKNRREDLEIPFVNGIYLGDDNVNHNRIKHRDNFGAPKYNIVPFGYYRIGSKFFYFKSLMNALGWDNMLIDAVYEVGMNNELLHAKPPIAIMGLDGTVNSQVISSGAVSVFENENVKVQSLLPPENRRLLDTIPLIEKSMSDGSANETMGGNLPDSEQKAYSVAQAQANAKIVLKGQMKSLATSMIYFGDLMKDIALNHYTIAEIDDMTGKGSKLKYRQFFLENKKSAGKMKDKKIKLDSGLIGKKMTKKEKEMEEYKMLEEVGEGNSLIRINPAMIAKFKYLTKIDLEEMFTKNQEYWQPILMGLKNQLANDPYTNQEGLTRKLMYSFFRSEGDELVQEAPQQQEQTKRSGVGNQIENAIQSQGVGQMMNTPKTI